MATWTLSAKYKKSTIEREHFVKDGQYITVENGWRGGSFIVTTEDDEIPKYDVVNTNGTDIYDDYPINVEEVELNDTYDGCWLDI